MSLCSAACPSWIKRILTKVPTWSSVPVLLHVVASQLPTVSTLHYCQPFLEIIPQFFWCVSFLWAGVACLDSGLHTRRWQCCQQRFFGNVVKPPTFEIWQSVAEQQLCKCTKDASSSLRLFCRFWGWFFQPQSQSMQYLQQPTVDSQMSQWKANEMTAWKVGNQSKLHCMFCRSNVQYVQFITCKNTGTFL